MPPRRVHRAAWPPRGPVAPWLVGLGLAALGLALVAAAPAPTPADDQIGPPLRLEAADGGLLDLGGLGQIAGRGQAIHIGATGAGSRVVLTGLRTLLNQGPGAATTVAAAGGGAIRLNPAVSRFSAGATLQLSEDGEVSVGTLGLEAGARLIGQGTLTGSLDNDGLVSPGSGPGAPGAITITGDYRQGASGTLAVELGGPAAGSGFDQILVGGGLSLAGGLTVSPIGAWVPTAGGAFPILTASTRTGSFASAAGLAWPGGGTLTLAYDATSARLQATGPGFLDRTGPTIAGLTYDGVALVDGFTATRPGRISLTATDPSAVARVAFSADGVPITTVTSPTDQFSALWDIAAWPDGPLELTVDAWDTFGNQSSLRLPLRVALAPPPPPVITAPADGSAVNQPELPVTGTVATDATSVYLLRDGAPLGDAVPVLNGAFATTVTLPDGDSRISASAVNRAGTGAAGEAVRVTVDRDIPAAPFGLYAAAEPAGVVRLSWSASRDPRIIGYDLFRAGSAFADPAMAARVNPAPLADSQYADRPPADGPWFYRVVAVNRAGSRGAPSNQASVLADRAAPVALAIDYAPRGPHDPVTGRVGVGVVDVTVEVSEPLLTTPFLSLTPTGGLAQAVALTWAGETRYLGSVEIGAGTPSGLARAVFSARDAAGNRGSAILAGATLPIDTAGPVATGFSFTPADPIPGDPTAPPTVSLAFGLSEPLAAGTAPLVTWRLSAPGRAEQPVVLAADGTGGYVGGFGLPADAGATGPETLTFRFAARDDLGNSGSLIQGPHTAQVYQGALPPLATPAALAAVALPDGAVGLAWHPVAEAADYMLLRAAGDAAPVPLLRTNGALTWTDRPGTDGPYRYAVASVRAANGHEGLSAPSAAVAVVADSVPPALPGGLALAVLPTGVQATWQAAADPDPLTYQLYRVPGLATGPPVGLEPVLADIAATSALDPAPPQPVDGRLSYAVGAADLAGNRALPVDWAAVNATLLPVANLSVTQVGADFPVLAWQHANPLAGFDLHIGEGADRRQVNAVALTQPLFTDLGWPGGERLYTVTALDADGGASLGRALRLPALSARRLADGSPDGREAGLADESAPALRRNLLNRLAYRIDNAGSEPAQGVVLALTLADQTLRSAPVDVPAGGSATTSVVVGGDPDLPDQMTLTVALEQAPNPGEQVRIVRDEPVEVGDGILLVDLLARHLTRGGTAEVRLVLENAGTVPLQLVTATNGGAAGSNEVRFTLLDTDGNPLGTAALRQAFGSGVSTLPDGRVITEVPAGGRFESDWQPLPIPSAAPDTLSLVLAIDRLHHRLGTPDAVSVPGPGSRRELALTDPDYRGELLGITPALSYGDQPVRISGRALDRLTGAPVPRAPLSLVLAGHGFERAFALVTDADGGFHYDYAPLAGESGVYRVSVLHPDLTERPEQGRFSIARVFVDPARREVRLPRNAATELRFAVRSGRDFPVTDLRLEYRAEDQVFGGFEPGLALTSGTPVTLAADRLGSLSATLHANDDAPASGPVVLRLVANETGGAPLALVRVDYALSAAVPALFAQPGWLELGTAPGGSAQGRIRLTNQGLAPLLGLRAALVPVSAGTAADWAFLNQPETAGALPVGGEVGLDLTLQPGADVAEGVHEFALRVRADNHAARDIPVYAYVTRAGAGGMLFHVADIYTATLGSDGQPVRGLAGASIQVEQERFPGNTRSGRTDGDGELLFADLPAGRYLFRVSAPDHRPVTGRFTVQPGITAARPVFLDYDLITIEWEVVELALEDRYQIVLTAIYETDVPAPVLVIEPPGVTLPPMAAGEVYQGSFTVTNYGLIRADDVRLLPPADDEDYDYEFLASVPTSLGAKERATVPYRVMALRSTRPAVPPPSTSSGRAAPAPITPGSVQSAGVCRSAEAAIIHQFICANGEPSAGRAGHRIYSNVGAGCRGDLPPNGRHHFTPGGPGGPVEPVTIPIFPCPPNCKGDCCDRYGHRGGTPPGGGGASGGGR